MTKRKELLLDRSKWSPGQGGNTSSPRTSQSSELPAGLRCCPGFEAEQLHYKLMATKVKSVPYWVGVRKDKYTGHDVIRAATEDVTGAKYPQFDYVLGPFTSKAAAEARAKREKNITGTFTDPYCNDGGGR